MLFLFSDVDECQTPGRCPYNCTNTPGSYTCNCPPCYDPDGANCVLNKCKINDICYQYNKVNPDNQCQVLNLQCSGSLTKFICSMYVNVLRGSKLESKLRDKPRGPGRSVQSIMLQMKRSSSLGDLDLTTGYKGRNVRESYFMAIYKG